MTTDATFAADVLEHERPVLVEFGAQWCPPCRMIAPVLAEIAAERADSLTVREIDTDANPETARRYQVMSLPTLIVFRSGEPVATFVGARTKARLLAELDRVTGSAATL
ncbi:thioredoxin [Amycolatopsis rhabdoformis]|uniref:Thioredoxin n=1 Tax=Amycolatopsis rhabdoformis TaxID=1448059 RepID=A0ABZ1HY70_9PSEU|nr:thioredoxin [Amycolatopsis rhabdoformis]WSE26523.1 thioredoxin [Amycolatopsis rhabdoformis]